MTTHFNEDKLSLELERDVLHALADAVKDRADNLEVNMDYAYNSFYAKAGYTEIAQFRDLTRLHDLLTKRLEHCYAHGRTKTRFSLPVSYVYLLHKEIVFSFNSVALQAAIDRIDKAIKDYPYSNRLALR